MFCRSTKIISGRVFRLNNPFTKVQDVLHGCNMDLKIFKGLGVVTGKFYNMHQDWSKAPEWVKEHYKIEEQQHCGDITTIPQGAIKGAVQAVGEFAKQSPLDATLMGKEMAKTVGITDQQGFAFSSGFLQTANLSQK